MDNFDTSNTSEIVPGVGHNSADDLPAVDQIISELEVTHAAALARVAELQEKGAKFFVITNDAEDDAATEFLVPIRSRWKASEADRVAAKDPWETRAGAVHAWFKTKILDALGRAPDNPKETFDPVTRTDLGMGPRINMAQTIYKREKVEKERKAREAEANRLREEERVARETREAAERVRRAEEDRIAREQAAAAAEARRAAEEAAAAASRKRNETSKAEAEKAAAEARKLALEAEEAQRAARERQDAERAQRDAQAREEENKAAEARAEAERAASATSADLSRSRGGKAGISSLKESVAVRDVDRTALDYAAIGPYFTDKATEAALTGYAAANQATVKTGIKTGVQPIKGAIFYIFSKSAGRS